MCTEGVEWLDNHSNESPSGRLTSYTLPPSHTQQMTIENLMQVARTLLQPQDFIEVKEFDTHLLALKRPFQVPVI